MDCAYIFKSKSLLAALCDSALAFGFVSIYIDVCKCIC